MRVEGDPHMGSPSWAIEECNVPQMLLDDLLDDRQPQARAAHPRGHVGFRQAFPILRKADARIHDVDDQLAILLTDLEVYAVASEIVLSPALASLDRLNGILDHVA